MRLHRPLILLAATALVAGCDALASTFGLGAPTSPFMLYGRDDLRAGMRFEDLEAAADGESKLRYTCTPIGARHRTCFIRTQPGDLRAIVDPDGRVVRLTVVTRDSLLYDQVPLQGRAVYENVVASMRRSWDSVSTVTQDQEVAPVEYSWRDASGTWSAQLWYGSLRWYLPQETLRWLPPDMFRDSLAAVPDSIAITHDSSYAALSAALGGLIP